MPEPDHTAATFAANRADAGARLVYRSGDSISRLVDLAEWGGYRVKFPDMTTRAEAVLINTGGGMAGGDALALNVSLDPDAALTFTTQSAERIYRSVDGPTRVTVDLSVGAGADLAFIPQETILYSHARLGRTITANLAEDSRLLLAEILVFGRAASGERMLGGSLHDRWRLRRGGRLVYADDVRLAGGISDNLDRAAIGAGAGATGCVVLISPDAPDRLDEARQLIDATPCRAAASTWNGILVIRALGAAADVRRTLATAIGGLLRCTLPRVWSL